MNNNYLKNLTTEYVGRNLLYYKTIDSTQKELWRQIENVKDGTLIIAENQTDAIGTHGRTWYTLEKNNIAFSFVVFPECNINKLDNFTLEIAQIMLDVFLKKCNIKLEIKLPNDIMINNKKVGGILTETKINGNIVKKIVIGIGINTNQIKFPDEIIDIATSIKNEFNLEIDNKEVISEFCNIFEKKFKERIK